MVTAGEVLGDPGLPAVLTRLGLRPADRADLLPVAAAVHRRPSDLVAVEELAAALRAGLDHFPGEPGRYAFGGYEAAADPHGPGILPLLALVVTAPDLAAYHRSRGVPAAVSAATLRELGQQVWVGRLGTGRLSLPAHAWLTVTWSGSLYWLGRLQFNLERLPGEWVCSTHVPRTGPLDPAAVDDSLARAAGFFPRSFPDRPVRDFWCRSWLLDPALADALDPASNIARFAARWRRYGEPMPGDEDALFFTFTRRGPVDLDALPQDTSLQRAIVARLRGGAHWAVQDGRIPLAEVPDAP